ncbi:MULTISPECIES: serine/threonine protein kinase [Microcystis]|uniref:Protein kinase n=1 Tax=Microcystis viridis FACHB-1342 TaxID=2692900 RepID=A0ABR8GI60_MICVR|nr:MULTISPECIES: protein kinase [Microcystis]MBD2602821.1 protein kinase [Microcystis viridis FACHB-1342]MDB9387133.1 protein kinase [Microcystis aeruginosa CS-583]
MMLQVGDIVDGKYKVTGLCSDSGGMGTILFVDALISNPPFQLVLKYCKDTDPEAIQRFCRETKYLGKFQGNSKVLQIYDSNIHHSPAYFVMQYYADGDLTKVADRLMNDIAYQEIVFYKMIDCIAELHQEGYQHRDIKPQNFLLNGSDVIVSDLGLAKAVGAGTTFTGSRDYWGTFGYMPPEFIDGDFKQASPPSDIFMLGKSFYWLLTKRDPLYLKDQNLHAAIFHVIERCCDHDKGKRYQSLAELKQDLNLAFDVILNRASGVDRAGQMLSQIINRLSNENRYLPTEIISLLDTLIVLSKDDRNPVISKLPQDFFVILSQPEFVDKVIEFFRYYEVFVKDAVDTWSYAEIVANYMKIMFERSNSDQTKAKALEIAVKGAIWANRFAAMDTCTAMIYSIQDDNLGMLVAPIIFSHANSFLKNLEVDQCRSNVIQIALRRIQKRQK